MMRRTIFLVLVVSFCAFISTAEVIKDLRAGSNGSFIVVTWRGDDETGVVGYKIERRTITRNSFDLLDARWPLRADKLYEYKDETVFRPTDDNVYQYKITPVLIDGSDGEPYRVTVTHSGVSGVRRTWGSIKAMFR